MCVRAHKVIHDITALCDLHMHVNVAVAKWFDDNVLGKRIRLDVRHHKQSTQTQHTCDELMYDSAKMSYQI